MKKTTNSHKYPSGSHPIIVMDGVPIQLQNPDLDGDGVVGGVESLTRTFDSGIIPINQQTELGETLKELNDDTISQSRMSGIDMRSRLHSSEITPVLALDALVGIGVLPVKCLSFTRQKKRLAVSLDGKGRDDIVKIVAGKKELEERTSGGIGNRIAGMFRPAPPQKT